MHDTPAGSFAASKGRFSVTNSALGGLFRELARFAKRAALRHWCLLVLICCLGHQLLGVAHARQLVPLRQSHLPDAKARYRTLRGAGRV